MDLILTENGDIFFIVDFSASCDFFKRKIAIKYYLFDYWVSDACSLNLPQRQALPSSDAPYSQFQSVQFSHSVMSNSLRPQGLQHTRLPCPPPTPRASSNSCPLSQWCHPTPVSAPPKWFCFIKDLARNIWFKYSLLWLQFLNEHQPMNNPFQSMAILHFIRKIDKLRRKLTSLKYISMNI